MDHTHSIVLNINYVKDSFGVILIPLYIHVKTASIESIFYQYQTT